MPLLETKWLAIFMSKPFCHWAGAVSHGQQHKFGVGGYLSLYRGSLPWKKHSGVYAPFCHWMGAVCHGQQHKWGGGDFVTGWGQFVMQRTPMIAGCRLMR